MKRVKESQDRLREEMRVRELQRELDLGLEDLGRGRSSTVKRNTLKEIAGEGRKKLTALGARKGR